MECKPRFFFWELHHEPCLSPFRNPKTPHLMCVLLLRRESGQVANRKIVTSLSHLNDAAYNSLVLTIQRCRDINTHSSLIQYLKI